MGKSADVNIQLREDRRASATSYDPKMGVSHNEFARRKSSVVQHVEEIDERAMVPDDVDRFAHLDKKKILRKMDMHLLPMLTALYLLSFLDRGNIGNAKIEGMAEDLHLTGAQYNWCLTIFFFPYCV